MPLKLEQQRYRPKSGMRTRGPWCRLTVCFSPEQMQAIHDEARQRNCTVAFAIRYLVDVGLAVEQEPPR